MDCESCANNIDDEIPPWCFKHSCTYPRICRWFELDCVECVHFNCYDDGDNRWDIWCGMPTDWDIETERPKEFCKFFKKKVKCAYCSSTDTQCIPNPYDLAINDETNKMWLCKSCEEEREQEI